MKNKEWIYKWNNWLNPEPVLTGVYRRRAGGFFIRATLTNPTTRKREEVRRVLSNVTKPSEAARIRRELAADKKTAAKSKRSETQYFDEFAATLLARKMACGEIRSEAGRRKWESILELHLVPRFKQFRMHRLTRDAVAEWRDEMAIQAKKRKLAPATANTRLNVMRVICRAASAELSLGGDLTEDIHDVPRGDWRTYTVDKPNALRPDQLQEFLRLFLEEYPQHYAMAALGFITGLRPSHINPLRRRGADTDIRWETGDLLVRQSVTYRTVMNTAKTGRDQCISLPSEMMSILKWHEGRIPPGCPNSSDLLFPAQDGGYHGASILDKPFRRTSQRMALAHAVTPRAMRRTFIDVTRVAGVEDKITRAVSGHSTVKMHWHYSTIGREEVRGELSRVMELSGFAAPN